MGVTAGIFLASILIKEMRYLVYIRYLCQGLCAVQRLTSELHKGPGYEVGTFLERPIVMLFLSNCVILLLYLLGYEVDWEESSNSVQCLHTLSHAALEEKVSNNRKN